MLNIAQMGFFTGGGFHPLYNAVLAAGVAAGDTLPSLPWQIKQNTMLVSLLNKGIWSLTDIFYCMYHDGSAGFSRINWKNPSLFRCSESTSGISYTPLDGYKSIGGLSGGYLDTGWSESTDGINYQLGNSAFFIDIKESGQDNGYVCGAQDGTAPITRLRTRTTGDLLGVRIDNNNNEIQFSNLDGSGIYLVERLSSNVKTYRENVLLSNVTNTSNPARVVSTHNILRSNSAGSTTSNKTVRFYGTFGHLGGLESDLFTIINNYKI